MSAEEDRVLPPSGRMKVEEFELLYRESKDIKFHVFVNKKESIGGYSALTMERLSDVLEREGSRSGDETGRNGSTSSNKGTAVSGRSQPSSASHKTAKDIKPANSALSDSRPDADEDASGEPLQPPAPLPRVICVGYTGAGKTSFIETATGNYMNSEELGTFEVREWPGIFENRTVMFVDLPGVGTVKDDGSEFTDLEVLKLLIDWVKSIEGKSQEILAYLLLYELSKNLQTPALNNIKVLVAFWGPEAWKNVFLATTHWEQVERDQRKRVPFERREGQLINSGVWGALGPPSVKRRLRFIKDDQAQAVYRIMAPVLLLGPSATPAAAREFDSTNDVRLTAAGKLCQDQRDLRPDPPPPATISTPAEPAEPPPPVTPSTSAEPAEPAREVNLVAVAMATAATTALALSGVFFIAAPALPVVAGLYGVDSVLFGAGAAVISFQALGRLQNKKNREK